MEPNLSPGDDVDQRCCVGRQQGVTVVDNMDDGGSEAALVNNTLHTRGMHQPVDGAVASPCCVLCLCLSCLHVCVCVPRGCFDVRSLIPEETMSVYKFKCAPAA